MPGPDTACGGNARKRAWGLGDLRLTSPDRMAGDLRAEDDFRIITDRNLLTSAGVPALAGVAVEFRSAGVPALAGVALKFRLKAGLQHAQLWPSCHLALNLSTLTENGGNS